MSSQQEDRHPNRKSQTQQKVLTQKEDSLRKCLPKKADTQTGNHKPTERFAQKEDSLRNFLPNKQNGTQTANQKPNRNTCPRKETYYENAFPTRRPTPKQQTEIRKRRFAPERRLVKNMSSQQEDRHPNRKSQTQQEVLTQKEDSLIGAQVSQDSKLENLQTCGRRAWLNNFNKFLNLQNLQNLECWKRQPRFCNLDRFQNFQNLQNPVLRAWFKFTKRQNLKAFEPSFQISQISLPAKLQNLVSISAGFGSQKVSKLVKLQNFKSSEPGFPVSQDSKLEILQTCARRTWCNNFDGFQNL